MKCPKCSNPKMCKDGFSRGKYIVRRLHKCYKCGKRASEIIPEMSNLDWNKSREYSTAMSFAQQLRYKEATAEEKQAWKAAICAARAAKSVKSDPRGKSNFIGMLGDIEVYALDFAGMGRQPQDLPAQWARTTDGKPELKVKKPG